MVIKHIKVVSHTRKERRTLTKKVNNIIKLVDKERYNKARAKKARNIAIVVGIVALVALATIGVLVSIPGVL